MGGGWYCPLTCGCRAWGGWASDDGGRPGMEVGGSPLGKLEGGKPLRIC